MSERIKRITPGLGAKTGLRARRETLAIPMLGLVSRVCALSLVLGFVASPAFAEARPRFEVRAESASAPGNPHLGAAFRVGLVCNDPDFDFSKIVRIRFEIVDDRWNVVQAWRRVSARDSATPEWIWQASLQGFDLGDQRLPEVTVVYPDERGLLENEKAMTPAVFIAGVLPQGEEPAALPARGVVDISTPTWPYLLVLALICLATLAAYLLLRRRRRRARNEGATPATAGPSLSAYDWALMEIERRRNLEPCIEGESKTIASMASDLIRGYLERRFAISALEMTTYECMREVGGAIHDEKSIRVVGAFLDECDLVKFAKVPLPAPRWQGIWDDAVAIVLITQPKAETASETSEPREASAAEETEEASVR